MDRLDIEREKRARLNLSTRAGSVSACPQWSE